MEYLRFKKVRKEIIDQTAHFTVGVAIIGPVVVAPCVLTIVWSAFMVGLVREVTEEGAPVTPSKILKAARGSKLDLSFWIAGGIFLAWATGQPLAPPAWGGMSRESDEIICVDDVGQSVYTTEQAYIERYVKGQHE